MAMTTIHAPWVNFVASTMISTDPVSTKPIALTTRLRIMRARSLESVVPLSSLVQCRIMPNWLSVNDTNTPTMYSWMSAVTSAR